MKKILNTKKNEEPLRPLSPQPGPSKVYISTSVQEESKEKESSAANESDSALDSDNSVSMSGQRAKKPIRRKKYILKNTKPSGSNIKLLRNG